MATIFSDTFESNNLTAWDSTTVTGTGATLSTSISAVKNGTYGMRAVAAATTDESVTARANKAFTQPSSLIICVEFWVRFNAYTASGYANSTSKSLIRLGNDTAEDATARGLGLVVVGSSTVQPTYRSKSGTDNLFGSTLAMSTTWYAFRCTIDKSGTNPIGTISYSTDGSSFTQLGTVTDSTSGTNGIGASINLLAIGIVHLNQFEQAQYTLDFDDVFVYDAVPTGGWGGLFSTTRNRLVIA